MLRYNKAPALTRQTSTSLVPSSQVTEIVSSDASGREETPQGDVILVTGGNGFLGQHVIKQLQENAAHVREIRVLDVWPFVQKLDYEAKKPVTVFTGSVTDADFVRRSMWDVDSVIHIAGLVSYGTFPDFKGMEHVNVNGTLNIIRACLQHNVSRLLYCSTVDVVIGFEPIRGGTEDSTPVPKKLLFPGYPETKLQAERLVLAANGRQCSDGGTLHTLSLRANVMYGELDPYYVTSGLHSAQSTLGTLLQVGDGRAQFQQCYVGNAAAAFVQADAGLRENAKLGGEFFFIPDDTPIQNSFRFMEPFLHSHGFKLSRAAIPFWLAYGWLYALELMLKALSPLVKINLKQASCSIKYINMDLYFKADKAKKLFNYTPAYLPQEALERSMTYYKSLKL